MDATEVAVGMAVRYPRTGTAGNVARIEVIEDETFAALDSTGLLYRVDTLEPAAHPTRHHAKKSRDLESLVRKEAEFGKDISDAWQNIDNACEGGG
ncbi:DUF2098 domain-containing protein [Methanofollis aquaemaris]|uniref:DUF2098 domain-containing protein n=1 Tax=Methanofollis aquaemaris TaxID=126734 RepID=A0A8A3S6D5_9EURY|nr:DUF2098 domain-containing protein [Methanofollis aquaemaris]QSZ67281.1 DUF2098 domain-containing protein [Methanofollis aquaemaris]